MKHFYFVEENTGEEFIVGDNDLYNATLTAQDIARDIAHQYGEEPDLSYEYEMTDQEAEDSGLDEY